MVLSVGFLAAAAYAASPGPSATTTTTVCQPTAAPFVVTQAYWGAQGSSLSVSPGNQDVPLSVSLLYTGPCTATAASFELDLSQPFTAADGQPSPTTYEVNLSPDTVVTESYYLNVNASASLGTYDLQLSIGYNTSSYLGLFSQTVQLTVPLKGSVVLAFSSDTPTLYPGATNNVTVSVTNDGTGTATYVTPSVSTNAQVAILSQLSEVDAMAPGASSVQTLRVYVPSSLAGSAVSLTLSAGYYDAYSNARSASQALGFTVSSQSPVTILFSTATPALEAGEVNNLTILVTNTGTGTASSLSFSVSAPSQLAILNQLPTVTSLAPGNEASETVQVFVPSSLSGSAVTLTFAASYQDSLGASRSVTQSLGFYVLSSSSSAPFAIQGVQWGSADLSPQPGDRNVPLTVVVQYLGASTATNLKATLSLPSGFTDENSDPTAVTYASTAAQDQAITLSFYLDLSGTLTPGSYGFPLTLAWTTSSASGLSENVSISPPPIGQSSGAVGTALSLTQSNNTVVAGASTTTDFVLKNVGSDSVFSPEFSLAVTSPLVVMGALPTGSLSVLDSGSSTVLAAILSSSPSATPGVYGGTLTVSYTDFSGTQHTQNFPVGFVLTGSIELVLQDVEVTQTSSSVTVSGSILNEGSAAAYYSSVTGSVGHSTTGNESADYVGEIDPNTPTPFTVTIPYQAPNSPQPRAEIAIDVAFRNSFGANSTFNGSSTASLESAQQLFQGTATSSGSSTGTGGGRLVTLVSYGIVAVIVIAAVAGGIVVRRRRAPKSRKEDRVI